MFKLPYSLGPFRALTGFLLLALVVVLASVTMSGCSTFQKPVTPEDYIQSAKAQVGAAYKTVGDLKAQGAITAVQGGGYFVKIEKVEVQVRNGEVLLRNGKPTDAQSIVNTALAALLLIQSDLKADQAKAKAS